MPLPHAFVLLTWPLVSVCAMIAVNAEAGDAGWQVVGQQGILLHVVVPAEQARDRAAYQRQVPALCGSRETCFVNFYTNSTGAAAAIPLPAPIADEATAVLRRSAKQGVDGFRWSCRMAMPEPNCF